MSSYILCDLRENSIQPITRCIHRKQEWLIEVRVGQEDLIKECLNCMKARLHSSVQSDVVRYLVTFLLALPFHDVALWVQ